MSIEELIAGNATEQALTSILDRIHKDGPIYPQDFEQLSYFKKYNHEIFEKYESKIVHLIGLFYKVSDPENLLEEVYSLYADAIEDETGRRFTPVQASAFKQIKNKRYFSFSAPTSSGKSYLFRELIQNIKGDIIIVVPSRALIAEYIYTVMNLVDKSVLVLQFIENINISKTSRRIYIITPERGDELFKLVDELNIEMFLFDEAQISEEPVRGMKFDSFVRRVDKQIPNSKKVFAHPFILNPEAQLEKHTFNTDAHSIRYDHNSVGKIYLSVEDGGFFYFSPFEEKVKKQIFKTDRDIAEEILNSGGTLLVYTSKTKLYDGTYLVDFSKYIELCPKIKDTDAIEIVTRLRKFIGASEKMGEKHSAMIDMMERGIVIHHGSMPLKARLLIENFVNGNHAKICFATSTLTQGINMPFDLVWINNFRFQGTEDQKNLDLKNLIGRAGRSTSRDNIFDFGYVVVENRNLNKFCNRIQSTSSLKKESSLDANIEQIPDDLKDLAEAIQEDSFDTDLQLTLSQIDRLNKSDTNDDIQFILDTLVLDDVPLTGSGYYRLSETDRKKVKASFKKIYLSHLRKDVLSKGEASILSVSIPILLWKIQGKSFKEIISLRHAFLTDKDAQRAILSKLKKGELTPKEAAVERYKIKIRYSTIATYLPNSRASTASIFPRNTSVTNFDYDILVYDTYDYIDKVISLSLAAPLMAAFQIYYDKNKDNRALTIKNFIRYGTNNSTEIWLLKYGFGFEDIEWIVPYIESIDEKMICFHETIHNLEPDKYSIIERYV